MAIKKQEEKKGITKTKIILTDNEIRDITNHLEKGIPLPDEYRFLLFGDKREVELVWNGKSGEISNIVLPFQTIEQVDEPRKGDSGEEKQGNLFDFTTDIRGRQLKGWVNKLIWGDNKLVLSSLKNGHPLREEIEKQGGIKLIYIDPPFDVGADFSMKINIGDDELIKEPNVLEELAFRDTWGKGADSFIAMMYERLMLMRDLLSKDGAICVHCDYRVVAYLRLIMDEIFGKENFRNEIIVRRVRKNVREREKVPRMNIGFDSILFYAKSEHLINPPTKEFKREDRWHGFLADGHRNGMDYDLFGIRPPSNKHWFWTKERAMEAIKEGKLRPNPQNGQPEYFIPASEEDLRDNLWDDIVAYDFKTGYKTEKKEAFMELIIKMCSVKGDLIADFFCGSGTTLAAAENLGRSWIGVDLGKFAIHTTRKRLIGVQRELKKEGKDFRAFEILNLGRYERQHYVGVNPNLRDEEKQKQLLQKEQEFVKLILHAYRAEAVQGFNTFSGKKLSRMVAIGSINLPVGRLFVGECIDEAVKNKITKIDVLAFEFEMGLFPHIQEEAKQRGVDLSLKQIPREVFDKRAVEKNQVVFTDVSYIEIIPHYDGDKVAIELADFSVFYNQYSVKEAEETLKNNSNKIVIDSGNIIKVSKDKDGIVTREPLVKKWTDWIDYWAVDFDFENKKEIIKVEKQKEQTGILDLEKEYEEKWTGDYIFENEWQSFRTKKNQKLELKTPLRKIGEKRKIAIKVVDIFGNDTMKIIEIRRGKN